MISSKSVTMFILPTAKTESRSVLPMVLRKSLSALSFLGFASLGSQI